MNNLTSRRWWMFLPLILCFGVIFYYYRQETVRSRPKYIIAENSDSIDPWEQLSTPATTAVRKKTPPYDEVQQTLEDYGFMQTDRLLELLAVRLMPPEEKKNLFRQFFHEDDELLVLDLPFTDQQLQARQDIWIKSGNITLANQRQMLTEEKIMQYAALELLIQQELQKISRTPETADKQTLAYLLQIQASIR